MHRRGRAVRQAHVPAVAILLTDSVERFYIFELFKSFVNKFQAKSQEILPLYVAQSQSV